MRTYYFQVDLNIDGEIDGPEPEDRQYFIQVTAPSAEVARQMVEEYVEMEVLDNDREEYIWYPYPITAEEFEAAKKHPTFPSVPVL